MAILKRILLIPIYVVLFAILAIAMIPMIGFLAIQEYIAKLRFHRGHEGEVFVIVSPRRGWHEFVTNNLVPVLPKGCAIEWHAGRRSRDHVDSAIVRRLTSKGEVGTKPVLVRVGRKRLEIRRLHELLQPIKRGGLRKDPAIMRRVQIVIERIAS